MKATFKVEIAGKRGADSGAIGVLDSVMHSFGKDGDFRVVVHDGQQVVGTTEVRVRKDGTATQLDLELSQLASDSARESATKDTVLRPDGYVVFYVARSARRYSIRVLQGYGDASKPVWDSSTLVQGDLFATTLVRAGRYSLVNALGKGKGVVSVSEAGKDVSVLRENLAAGVDVAADGFHPDSVKVVQGQGLYFRVSTQARVVIDVTDEKELADSGPIWHWEQFRPKRK